MNRRPDLLLEKFRADTRPERCSREGVVKHLKAMGYSEHNVDTIASLATAGTQTRRETAEAQLLDQGNLSTLEEFLGKAAPALIHGQSELEDEDGQSE